MLTPIPAPTPSPELTAIGAAPKPLPAGPGAGGFSMSTASAEGPIESAEHLGCKTPVDPVAGTDSRGRVAVRLGVNGFDGHCPAKRFEESPPCSLIPDS